MNTPETDEAERMAYSQEYMVPTEFARRLERERDEAMEWKQIAEIRKDTIIQYQNRAVRAEEELDNIREQYRIAVDMAALAQNKLFIAKAELERLKK